MDQKTTMDGTAPKPPTVMCEAAYSYNTEGGSEAWFVKVDEHGMTLWNKTYGASGKNYTLGQ